MKVDLRELREQRGLGVCRAAEEIGISRQSLNRAEAGRPPLPRTAKRIAEFYGRKVDDIWAPTTSTCDYCSKEFSASPHHRAKNEYCSNRCRMRGQYGGACIDCGAETYNGVTSPPERCVYCTGRHNATYGPEGEGILEAIREWHARYGEVPTSTEWNPGMKKSCPNLDWEEIERRRKERQWPSVATVQKRFGSWSAAVEAAGFQCCPPGRWRDESKRRKVPSGSSD